MSGLVASNTVQSQIIHPVHPNCIMAIAKTHTKLANNSPLLRFTMSSNTVIGTSVSKSIEVVAKLDSHVYKVHLHDAFCLGKGTLLLVYLMT